MFDTAIVMITYKRPWTTRRVLERVAEVRPRRLYVASDGPRNESESAAIRETRGLFDRLSWDCEIQRDFAERNLGLALRVTSAITSAFERYDELIVLEDDTLPDPTFFTFCSELLERYRRDARVLQIKGTCAIPHPERADPHSYRFTQLASPWGWASWKRAWNGFDCSFFATEQARSRNDRSGRGRWRPVWPKVARDAELRARVEACGAYYRIWMRGCDTRMITNSWAGAFALSVVERDGLVASPLANLVSNIGFGPDAVHFRNTDHASAGSAVRPLAFPLVHPQALEIDGPFQRRCARAIDRGFLGRTKLDDKLAAARSRRPGRVVESSATRLVADARAVAPRREEPGACSLSIIIEWENVKNSDLDRARRMFEALFGQLRDRLRRQGEESAASPPAVRLRPDVEIILGFDSGAFALDEVQAAVERLRPALDPQWRLRYVFDDDVDYYEVKNLAAREATGDLLLFLDSDTIPDAGWLPAILAPFADPRVELASGHTYIAPRGAVARTFALSWFFPLRATTDETREGTDFFANNVAFRKSLFERYPFPQQFGTFRGACRNLAELLDREAVVGCRTSAAQVMHPPPNGLRHFVTRGLLQGRDFFLQREQDAYHVFVGLPLLDASILIAGQGLRGLRRIVGLRERVGLSRLGLPVALTIWSAYTLTQFVGLGIERLRPGLLARGASHGRPAPPRALRGS